MIPVHLLLSLLLFVFISVLSQDTATDNDDLLHLELYSTSDVHGWIYGHSHEEDYTADFGDYLSLLDQARANLPAKTSMLVVDSGDLTQGTGLSDGTEPPGRLVFDLAASIPYDLMTVGNHDLGDEGTVEYLKSVIPDWYGDAYVTTNVVDLNGAPFANRYRKQVLDNGLIMLEFGFLYQHGTSTYPGVTVLELEDVLAADWFLDILDTNRDLDILVLACHISSDDDNIDTLQTAFRTWYHDNMDGWDVPILFLTGHSHRWRFWQCYDLDNDSANTYDGQCWKIEPGCYFRDVSRLHIDVDRSQAHPVIASITQDDIVAAPESFADSVDIPIEDFPTSTGQALSLRINNDVDSLGLLEVIGCSKHLYDKYSDVDQSDSIFKLYLEGAYPMEVFTPEREALAIQLAVTGSSSLRYDIYPGEIVADDVYMVMPFKNEIVYFPQLRGDLAHCALDVVNGLLAPTPYGEGEGDADSLHPDIGYTSLPKYISAINVNDLVDDALYDLIITDYDIDRFSDALTGTCAHLGASSPCLPYPNAAPTDDVLRNYIKHNMICLSAGIKLGSMAQARSPVLDQVILVSLSGLLSLFAVSALLAVWGTSKKPKTRQLRSESSI